MGTELRLTATIVAIVQRQVTFEIHARAASDPEVLFASGRHLRAYITHQQARPTFGASPGRTEGLRNSSIFGDMLLADGGEDPSQEGDVGSAHRPHRHVS